MLRAHPDIEIKLWKMILVDGLDIKLWRPLEDMVCINMNSMHVLLLVLSHTYFIPCHETQEADI